MQQLSILFPTPLGCYDYLCEIPLPIGTFVIAPFGRKKMMGVVWNKEPNQKLEAEKLKKLKKYYHTNLFLQKPLNLSTGLVAIH